MTDPIQYTQNGKILVNNIRIGDIARKYGTPVYIISLDCIKSEINKLKNLISKYNEDILIHYTFKTNTIPPLCSFIAASGIGIEVSSFKELKLAIKIGVDPWKIVFNGPSKSREAITAAIEYGVKYINSETYSEILRIDETAGKLKKVLPIGLRVAPSVISTFLKRPSRFGFDCEDHQALECLRKINRLKNVRICGIHFHIGTQVNRVNHYFHAIDETVELIKNALKENLIDLHYFDIGGGFAHFPTTNRTDVIDFYKRNIEKDQLEKILDYTTKKLSCFSQKPTVIVEPGRLIVAKSAVLLTRVTEELSFKQVDGYIVDGAQSMVSSNVNMNMFHDILTERNHIESKLIPTNIFGSLCYESDIIALKLPLPKLHIDNLLVILDCGAYDINLSNDFILSRPPVLLLGNEREHFFNI